MTAADATPTTRIEGREPLLLPWDAAPEDVGIETFAGTIGFECASGDWLESEGTGVRVLPLLEAAAFPEATTHVRFESANGDTACVPLRDLDGAIVALGAGEGRVDGLPRFVSPRVLGPRTVKNLRRIEPLALAPGADREAYESLPID